jgi:hypothetical protein
MVGTVSVHVAAKRRVIIASSLQRHHRPATDLREVRDGNSTKLGDDEIVGVCHGFHGVVSGMSQIFGGLLFEVCTPSMVAHGPLVDACMNGATRHASVAINLLEQGRNGDVT